jgi:hypothetical protein
VNSHGHRKGVHNVPQEILSKIFLCIEDEGGNYDPIDTNPTLLRVCRFWRSVVFDCPELWNVTRCLRNDEMPRPGFEQWLRKARASSLVILFRCVSGRNWKTTSTNTEILWRKEVTPLLPRVKSLMIRDSYRSLVIAPFMQEITRLGAQIEHLSLAQVHDLGQYRGVFENLGATMPSLEELDIQDWIGSFPRIHFPNLLELRLDDCKIKSPDGVWSLIRQAPKMDTIQFQNCSFGPSNSSSLGSLPSLKNLTMLEVDDVEATQWPKIVQSLLYSSPNVTNLELSIPSIHLLRHQFPPANLLGKLRHLGIGFSVADSSFSNRQGKQWLQHVLQSALALRTLRIMATKLMDGSYIEGALGLPLSEQKAGLISVCPKLTSLVIYGHELSPMAIASIMVARAAPIELRQRAPCPFGMVRPGAETDFRLTYLIDGDDESDSADSEPKFHQVGWVEYVQSGSLPAAMAIRLFGVVIPGNKMLLD